MVYMPSSPEGFRPQTTTEMFGNLLPKVEITNVTLENKSYGYVDQFGLERQGLKVVVNLEIKIPITNSMMSSIFGSKELQKCIVVKVAMDNHRTKFMSMINDPEEIISHRSTLRRDVKTAQLWLSDFDEPDRITQENGETFEIYNHTVELMLQNAAWAKFVGLNVVSWLDGTAFQSGAYVQRPPRLDYGGLLLSGAKFYGPITSLLVIDNERISSTEYGVVDGEITPLAQVNKVQDFRVVDRVEALNFDFSIIEKDIFPNLQHDLRGNYLTMEKQTNHFSDIFLSRDIDNNCRLLFSINWKNIILDNSVFGKIFRDAPTFLIGYLLLRTKINNFKILRTRVEGSTQQKPVPRPKDFWQNDISDVIVEFSETQGTETLTARGYRALSHQGASIQEYDQKFEPNTSIWKSETRTWSCTDTGMSAKTDGYYKYTVELECIDETVGLIEEMLNGGIGANFLNQSSGGNRGLRDYIATFQNYYKDATKPAFDFRRRRRYSTQAINIPTPFNTKRNRFRPTFIQRYGAEEIQAIDGFVNLLDFFTNFDDDPTGSALLTSKDEIASALKAMSNPATASPQSIHTVLQLMETVASQIESILGVVYVNVPGVIGESETPEKKSQVTGKNRLFKVSDDSIDLFNAKQELHRGLDFVGSWALNRSRHITTVGLMVNTQEFLGNLGQFGISRYFKTTAGNLTITDIAGVPTTTNMDFLARDIATTFLSPLNVYTGRHGTDPNARSAGLSSPRISQIASINPPDFYLKTLYPQLAKLSKPFKSNWIDQTLSYVNRQGLDPGDEIRLDLSKELSEFFGSFFGLSMNPHLPSHASLGRNDPAFQEISAYMEEAYLLLKNIAMAYEPMMRMWTDIQFLSTQKLAIGELNDSKSINALQLYTIAGTAALPPGSLREQISDTTDIHSIPVQVKALMSLSIDNTVLQDSFLNIFRAGGVSGSPLFYRNFESEPAFEYTTQIINQLQVLDGYDIGLQKHGSQLLMKKPKWTPYHIAAATLARGRRYLCRISPYENEKYLITRNPKYDLPTYDEYFIMETTP